MEKKGQPKLWATAFVVGAILAFAGLLIPQSGLSISIISLVYMVMLAVPILVCRDTPGTLATFGGAFLGFVSYIFFRQLSLIEVMMFVFRFVFLLLFAFSAMIMVESQKKLGKLISVLTPAALYFCLSILATPIFVIFSAATYSIDLSKLASDSMLLLSAAGLVLPIAYEVLKETERQKKKDADAKNLEISNVESKFGRREIAACARPFQGAEQDAPHH